MTDEVGPGLDELTQVATSVLAATPSALLLVDEQGTIVFANALAESLFGYSRGQLGSLPVTELIPGRFRQDHGFKVRSFQRQGEARVLGRDSLVLGKRSDGSEVPIEIALSTVELDGQVHALAAITDVSERRRAQMAAAAANAHAQVALDAAPLAILTADLEGRFVSVNPAAERLLLYRAEELVGQHASVLHEARDLEGLQAEFDHQLSLLRHVEFEAGKPANMRLPLRDWRIRRKDGSWFVADLRLSAIDAHGDGQMTGVIGVLTDVTERRRADDNLLHMAHHDTLTGLPNRARLYSLVEAALVETAVVSGKLALLLIDIDHFKRLNDALGHHLGDQLLIDIAELIQRCLGTDDVLARIGGDEFVVVMPGIASEAQAAAGAQKILDALSRSIMIGGHLVKITASIGLAIYPDYSSDFATLMKHADLAMIEAKQRGRGICKLFTGDMARRLERRVSLERALPGAAARGEFSLRYQPEVSTRLGNAVGVEALLRWHHPEYGPVPPDEFIPIAEQTGLMVDIGNWVLRTACAEISAVNRALPVPVRLAVNYSPLQLFDRAVVDEITSVLGDLGIDPALFEVEITEVSLMENDGQQFQILDGLRHAGITITIDDFGTGYSSLSYLTHFPIDRIKIDKAFVHAASRSSETIVSAIIAMARELNIDVMAEGVETTGQQARLEAQGCFEFQGYLFARPVSAKDLPAEIEKLSSIAPVPVARHGAPTSSGVAVPKVASGP